MKEKVSLIAAIAHAPPALKTSTGKRGKTWHHDRYHAFCFAITMKEK